jgi:hypothetical protein
MSVEEDHWTFLKQGNTSLCLVMSVLMALKTDDRRKRFLQSDDPRDLEKLKYFAAVVQGEIDPKIKYRKPRIPKLRNGVMVGTIVKYLSYLQDIGVVRRFDVKRCSMKLEHFVRPKEGYDNRGKVFVLCGHHASPGRTRERVRRMLKHKNGFRLFDEFRARMAAGTVCGVGAKSRHAACIRFRDGENVAVLLDPARPGPRVLTEETFADEFVVSMFDLYNVLRFEVEFEGEN